MYTLSSLGHKTSEAVMASSVNFYLISVILCMLVFFHGYANGTVPAMYVFGDSLADVGNNDYLPLSVLRANFLPNGIDYNGGQATGRFSNGKNSADLLAEKLGLATSPPYLNITSDTNKTEAFISGVSFASGGAGVLDSTNKGECLTFPNQVDSFSTVHQTLVDAVGSDAAMNHFSKSIFCFIIGSNDILDYTRELIKPNPQDFVNSLVSNLQVQLQRLYSLGARKLVFVGTGPIGCCPSQRTQNSTNCNEQANQLSVLYNKGASNLLHDMKSNYTDFNYSFLDTSGALLQYLRNPTKYGFNVIKTACCGHGDLNANIPCLPNSSYCNNRKDHMFWDLFHPTEATDRLLTNTIFDGAAPFVYPINVKQLSNL